MSAPDYYWDRIKKLMELAKAWPEFSARQAVFKHVGIHPADDGLFLRTVDLPALVFSPVEENHTTYSTSRTSLEVVIRCSIFAYLDTAANSEKETKDVIRRIALLKRFLWTYKTVDQYWWFVAASGNSFVNFRYTTLSENGTGRTVQKVSGDVRLAVSKLDLTE